MKYVIVLGDGMADEPIEALNGKTPIEYASTPELDKLSEISEIGLVHTIPQGMKPGSDTANLSVLGYDPKKYYSGRSPLEALSIGVPMKSDDIALRCNIVTLSEEEGIPFEERVIIDHSSGEISTEDCSVLLECVKKELENEEFHFFTGTSYRHCLIWEKGRVLDLSQPHDILTRKIGPYLPGEDVFLEMMKKSFDILVNHPINVERKKRGENPANCCWFWGAGTKPALDPFLTVYHKKASMISAVDLLKGIAVGADMEVIKVDGANGGLDTNYEGKAQAALKSLLEDGKDMTYIHIEAPDEMGHQGSVEKKVRSIEYIDSRVIKLLREGFEKAGEDYRMLVLPDHPTPIRVRTHTSDPVPYLLYDSTKTYPQNGLRYNEKDAKTGGIFRESGVALMRHFLMED